MLKVTLLASVIASMALTGGVANAKSEVAPLNSTIIVEVDRDKDTLTKEGITNTQNIVMNNIRSYVTNNFRVVSKYSVIANAFAIKVNEDDIDAIRNVPGVKSVTIDKFHLVTKSVDKDPEPEDPSEDEDETPEYGGNDNMSAITMEKPEGTKEGEGTVIAILDNEFYFRGAYKENKVDKPAWYHETFSPLPDGVKQKFTAKNIPYTDLYASGFRVAGKKAGAEGSLYFNSKVPFYFDYGGELSHYYDDVTPDLDVSTEATYHGSHVASIAAGYAGEDGYQGIAPYAQLVCMKVFTNVIPDEMGKLAGYGVMSGARDVPLLNAIEDARKMNVDGINMSLGTTLDDFDKDSITNRVLQELCDAGIMTSISAGNDGKASYSSFDAYANWTTDMTETGILSGHSNLGSATIIAAGQPDKIFYEHAMELEDASGNIINVAYADQIVNRDEDDKEFEIEYKLEDLLAKYPDGVPWIYVGGFGKDSDYKLDDEAYIGKVVIVNRGQNTFADKYAIAVKKRAAALIVVNNDPTQTDFSFRMSFGDDFKPSIPCVYVLTKDGPTFQNKKNGKFLFANNKLSENPAKRTISTFSSDGATYDLDLKPDITAPGENIRGAVPPQKVEDKTEERRLHVYEFLSGTSMSAPNYAGAQALVLSKVAAGNKATQDKIQAERNKVDMKLMSTAVPMLDAEYNPEYDIDEDVHTLSSPRRQGAGMVNLTGAYNTEVYLEGFEQVDENGKPIGLKKSKIVLRNNADINNGNVVLRFIAHNESNAPVTYQPTITVMRPALAKTNEVITREYDYQGEISSKEALPLLTYWLMHTETEAKKYTNAIDVKVNDVYKVSSDIEFFATEAAVRSGTDADKTIIPKGKYYYTGANSTEWDELWKPVPDEEYMSVCDEVIAVLDADDGIPAVTLQPGDSVITLPTYSLSAETKQFIAEHFQYGCYIEGFVSLKAQVAAENTPDLSLPFMGYYGIGDNDYSTAPAVEPFNFEKKADQIYPSDLVNQICVDLIGKDSADMSSMWVAGYVENGKLPDINSVIVNKANFANLPGFYQVGYDEKNGKFYEDAEAHIYVGGEYASNVMIIQQFVMRSCADNYYTITNKKTGKVVFKSAMQDILYGSSMNRNQLYKSHIDGGWLGSGYVAHRAYTMIPLYNQETGEMFDSGEYEIKFNYLLAGTNSWVDKSYNFHIDSEAPEVSSLSFNGDKVRINIKEENLTFAKVDIRERTLDVVNNGNGTSYIELSRDDIIQYWLDNYNEEQDSGRLYLEFQDAAKNRTGVIIRFELNDDWEPILEKYTMVQNTNLKRSHDFEYDGVDVQIYTVDDIGQIPVTVTGFILVSEGPVNYGSITGGCSGNIATTSMILSLISAFGIVMLAISKTKKKNLLGGKK